MAKPTLTATPVPGNVCPGCGRNAGLTAHSTELSVKPGQMSICIPCGCLAVFGDDLRLRLVTPEEIDAMDPDLLLAVTRARRYRGSVLPALIAQQQRSGRRKP